MYGNEHALSQKEYLHTIPQRAKVLVIGGGSGFFLNELLKINPDCSIDYVEKSVKMIDLASKNVKNTANANFICTSFEEKTFEEKKYDAVICYFFLDLIQYAELGNIILKVKNLLKPEGKLLVADFKNSPLLKHRILLRSMYFFFKIATDIPVKELYDFDAIILQNTFEKKYYSTFYEGFIFSAVYEKK